MSEFPDKWGWVIPDDVRDYWEFSREDEISTVCSWLQVMRWRRNFRRFVGELSRSKQISEATAIQILNQLRSRKP